MIGSMVSVFIAGYATVGEGELQVHLHAAGGMANITEQSPHIGTVLGVGEEGPTGKRLKQ